MDRNLPGHTTALVLGGGGLAGVAFHAGVLAALHHDLGWNPDHARLVIGTSAGSIAAALLRSGALPEDLVAWATGAPPSTGGHKLRDLLDRVGETPWQLRPRLGLARPRVDHVRALLRGELAPVAGALLPAGWLRAHPMWSEIGNQEDGWPRRSLWIPALAVDDAQRVVFGRERFAPLDRAVMASCAVPAIFGPVDIDGRTYVDGGMYSSTNADLAAAAGIDHAIVVAPLTGVPARRGVRSDPIRALARWTLDAELEHLSGRGISVDVIEPDEDTARVMGRNLLSRSRMGAVARAAFLATGSQLSGSSRRSLAADRLADRSMG